MGKVSKRKWITRKGEEKFSWGYCVYDDEGNKHRESKFRTKIEAEKALAEVMHKINNGKLVKENKTLLFCDAVKDFEKHHINIYCKGSTKESYISYINKHFYPYFGKRKLVEIKANTIKAFIHKKMNENSLSKKTLNNMISLLGTFFQKFVDDEIIAVNPVSKIKKLTVEQKEMKYLTIEQSNALLRLAAKHYPDFYPFLFIAIATGARKNEISALCFNDIDFTNKKITINKSLYRGEITTPKTKRSFRTIDVPEKLLHVLKELKMKSYDKEGFIFRNKKGNPLDPDNLIKRRFNPLLKMAGIEHTSFHSIRHSYCSALISQNLPIKYISSQLGHSSIQITMDRYGHLLPEVHEKAKLALDNIFEDKPEIKLKKCV